MIFTILTSCLLASALCQEVYEDQDDIHPPDRTNVTSVLRPANSTKKMTEPSSSKFRSTKLMIPAKITREPKPKGTEPKDQLIEKTRSKNDAPTWNISATFVDPDTNSSETNDKPFKPSTQWADFYEHEDNKIKFEDNEVPYRIEKQRPKGFFKELDTKPTSTVPASIPAGGLYKIPYALHNGRPDNFDSDFPILHDEGHGYKMKTKSNPWKGLVHLVTALLPVGLIVSALSPSIITIQSPQGSRRVRSLADDQLISLQLKMCRRRLLCEIYAEPQHGKTIRTKTKPFRMEVLEEGNCSVYRCDDPRVMAKLVKWVRAQLGLLGGRKAKV